MIQTRIQGKGNPHESIKTKSTFTLPDFLLPVVRHSASHYVLCALRAEAEGSADQPGSLCHICYFLPDWRNSDRQSAAEPPVLLGTAHRSFVFSDTVCRLLDNEAGHLRRQQQDPYRSCMLRRRRHRRRDAQLRGGSSASFSFFSAFSSFSAFSLFSFSPFLTCRYILSILFFSTCSTTKCRFS